MGSSGPVDAGRRLSAPAAGSLLGGPRARATGARARDRLERRPLGALPACLPPRAGAARAPEARPAAGRDGRLRRPGHVRSPRRPARRRPARRPGRSRPKAARSVRATEGERRPRVAARAAAARAAAAERPARRGRDFGASSSWLVGTDRDPRAALRIAARTSRGARRRPRRPARAQRDRARSRRPAHRPRAPGRPPASSPPVARRVFFTGGRSFDLSTAAPSTGDLREANRFLATLRVAPRPWTFESCDLWLRLPGTWHVAVRPRSGCYPVLELRGPGVFGRPHRAAAR